MHLLLLRFANKKFLLPILGVFILAILFFPRSADAIVWLPIIAGLAIASYFFGDDLLNAAAKPLGDALAYFATFVFSLIAGILQTIYMALAGLMMKAVVYFMSIPTDPSKVALVQAGWDFTRGLANGFFLLILAFIGLATILRLQSYQFQRTLPLLIIAALLINFSGVFVSVIVDIGNLFTNFFLQGALQAPFYNSPWDNLPSKDPGLANVAINVARILYFLFGSLLFFAIFLIFGLRIIVLWVIVILAPIAFAAIILPFTRKWWQRWLSALMEWAFIGVPIAFFMYLASSILFMELPPDPTGAVGAAFLAALVPIAALVLLFLGISFSVGLASTLGGRFQTALQRAPKTFWRSKAGSKTKGWMAGRANKVIGALPGELQGISAWSKERAEKSKNPLNRWALRGTGAISGVAGNATSRVAGFAERPLMEAEQRNRKLALPAGFEKWGPERQAKWINSLMFASDRVQAGKVLSDNGNLRFTSKAFQDKYKKDADWAARNGDSFFQEEVLASERAYPEDLTEREVVERRLVRRGVTSGRQRKKFMKAYDKKEERRAELNEKEGRGERLTEGEVKERDAEFEDEELKGLGITKNQANIRQAVKDSRKKNKEARDDIGKALKKDEDGNDIHVGIDIEFGIKEKWITRDDANADRAKAVKDVRDKLTATGKMGEYEKTRRDRFLRDSAASKVFVRDERSQYVKNIADITGDDLGTRAGLAEGPSQHLREMQQTFGREAVLDVFNGAGGINDHIKADVDHYALNSSQMWGFLQSPLGREYPSEARNSMRDVHGNLTDNQAEHRKRVRVVQLAEQDKVLGQKQSLVGAYYEVLQEENRLQRIIDGGIREGLPDEEIKRHQDSLADIQMRIQAVEDFYVLGNDLDEDIAEEYGINLMDTQEQGTRRNRLKEVEKIWRRPSAPTRRRASRGAGDEGEDEGLEDEDEGLDDMGGPIPRVPGGGPGGGAPGGGTRRGRRTGPPTPWGLPPGARRASAAELAQQLTRAEEQLRAAQTSEEAGNWEQEATRLQAEIADIQRLREEESRQNPSPPPPRPRRRR